MRAPNKVDCCRLNFGVVRCERTARNQLLHRSASLAKGAKQLLVACPTEDLFNSKKVGEQREANNGQLSSRRTESIKFGAGAKGERG